VTTAAELEAAPADQRPTASASDAAELDEALDRFSREG
jgi:hypothetical protein